MTLIRPSSSLGRWMALQGAPAATSFTFGPIAVEPSVRRGTLAEALPEQDGR